MEYFRHLLYKYNKNDSKRSIVHALKIVSRNAKGQTMEVAKIGNLVTVM